MFAKPRLEKFDPYSGIEIARYYLGLYRYTCLNETPSEIFVYSMIFFHHGLSLKRHGRPLLNEHLYFDGQAIKIASLLKTNSEGETDFIDFSKEPSLCPSNKFVRESANSVFRSYVNTSNKELLRMLAHPFMPFSKCQELGLKNGDKVDSDIIANCF